MTTTTTTLEVGNIARRRMTFTDKRCGKYGIVKKSYAWNMEGTVVEVKDGRARVRWTTDQIAIPGSNCWSHGFGDAIRARDVKRTWVAIKFLTVAAK